MVWQHGCRGPVVVTYNMALTILEQEVEHEEDLQSLKEDLELMVSRGSR